MGCRCEHPGETGSAPVANERSAAQADSPWAALRAGTARVEIADGRITILSHGARNLEILNQLADLAEFEVSVLGPHSKPVFIAVDTPALDDAIGIVLAGVAYGLEYELEADPGGATSEHVLARVAVGEPGGMALLPESELADTEGRRRPGGRRAAPGRPGHAKENRRERPPPPPPPSAEERRRRAAAAARRELADAEEAAALRADLDDPVPEVRREALTLIDREHIDLADLVSRARTDGDPAVREAAVERLAEIDGYASVRGLLATLADPAPGVVLASLEALQQVGDPSLVPELAFLLDHRDERVRASALETIAYLE